MTRENQQTLFARYPDLFREAAKSPRESCMGRGIECGDGWLKLIDSLCAQLTVIQRASGLTVVFQQVKEKFATLRVYFQFGEGTPQGDETTAVWRDIVQAVVRNAESQSSRICEVTGDWGILHRKQGGSWLRTLNPKWATENGYVLYGDEEAAE